MIDKKANVTQNFTDYVSYFAMTEPQAISVICNNKKYSYRQLKENVSSCAKGLITRGIKKGDKIAMLCTPRYEYYELFLATISIGAIWVGLNPKYSFNELNYIISDLRPKLMFSLSTYENRNYQEDINRLHGAHSFIQQLFSIDGKMQNCTDYIELKSNTDISDSAYRAVRQQVRKLSPAVIVYTSGSTGKPKGAVLSHHSLNFGALRQIEHFKVPKPKIICNFPINHVACIADICSTTLVKGGTIIFQESFEPNLMLNTIEQEKVNILGVVPTMLNMIFETPMFCAKHLLNIELVLWGGAAISESTLNQLSLSTPARLMTAFGMTETAAHTTYTTEYASLDELLTTIGKPDPKMPCRIANKKEIECEVGEVGELQFKGDYLFLEYFEQPESTHSAFTSDGWFKSGDLGSWNTDGTITLAGRSSDMYKSGGYNVYPREIELFLDAHDNVELSAVISIPDVRFQEVGIAFVISNSNNLNEEKLKNYCCSGLANYKIPKQIIFIEEAPLLSNGKIDKLSLIKSAKELVAHAG